MQIPVPFRSEEPTYEKFTLIACSSMFPLFFRKSFYLILLLWKIFALGGWMLLHQNLSFRESTGCVLLFAAVVLAQLPLGRLMRSKA